MKRRSAGVVATGVADQVTAAAVALAVACTLPSCATATHRPETLQDTAVRAIEPASSGVSCHDAWLVGFVESRTFPWSSTAAHSDALGQETAVTWFVPSTCMAVHGAALGVADVRTLPLLSPAKHSALVGHEIAYTWLVASMAVARVHAAELVGVALE